MHNFNITIPRVVQTRTHLNNNFITRIELLNILLNTLNPSIIIRSRFCLKVAHKNYSFFSILYKFIHRQRLTIYFWHQISDNNQKKAYGPYTNTAYLSAKYEKLHSENSHTTRLSCSSEKQRQRRKFTLGNRSVTISKAIDVVLSASKVSVFTGSRIHLLESIHRCAFLYYFHTPASIPNNRHC